ncbi:MAG: CapA family protein [Deltaproteobacteria bacterium]|nr:CapA family protein [Deltaproteobacteria bacterium]
MNRMEKSNNSVSLLAGADIGPVVEPVDQFADLVLPSLKEADLRFAQCERTYSEGGHSPGWGTGSGGGEHSRLHPRLASIWKTAQIDVASLASNHTMDWGPEALLDTLELFRGMGVQTVGAGKNEEEARRAIVLERKGIKIAFLAYCSVLRSGQAATGDRAGIAPMRAHTYYEAVDYQPGTPPKVVTVPYEEDLLALQGDIRKAKKQADIVVLSIHWGVRVLPKVIATYQPPVAHAAIDAGADLILGHHAHILKAVEVYKGKVCFYSMGNFMTTGSNDVRLPYLWNLYWYRIDPEYMPPRGRYHFPVDSEKTLLVKAVFGKHEVKRVSFLPAFINHRAQPETLKRDDPRFAEVLNYMEWVSDQYPHRFRIDQNEIVVQTR